jgi:hypothetical protein
VIDERITKMLTVEWGKCLLMSKCRLNLINLTNEFFNDLVGIYIIWSESDIKKTIYIGRGIIRNRLNEMKSDSEVQRYGPDLFVTWAEVPTAALDGVEAFLYNELNPIIKDNLACLDLINVNLP